MLFNRHFLGDCNKFPRWHWNTQGYLRQSVFSQNFQPNGEDRPWAERAIVQVENKRHKEVWGGYFSQGTKGRGNVAEKMSQTRRSDVWLFRKTFQQEAAAGRRVRWSQSLSACACTWHRTEGSPAWWQMKGGVGVRAVWLLSFLCAAGAVGIELPTLTIQLRSQNLTLGSVQLCGLFWPQWELKQQWQLNIIYYDVSLTPVGLVKWEKARAHQ